ncbi:hypothetical protein Ddye_000464 [Dipteronia dyeriana]|uniref:Uncharacterized protein n=1 Tax=Dipteronia dyeriana TaxID=168575 RepID=A0AAD9XLZ8_9ROSI|nr:hypothetical protein Ddye_000464 [Dipteronia dyeriana]
MNFSGVIIHRLLLWELHHNGPTVAMRFLLENHLVRFSKVEFYIITGLRFGVIPDTNLYAVVENGIHQQYFPETDERVSVGIRCCEALPHLYVELDIDGVGREIQDSNLSVSVGGGPRYLRCAPRLEGRHQSQGVDVYTVETYNIYGISHPLLMFVRTEIVPTTVETEAPYFEGLYGVEEPVCCEGQDADSGFGP